MTRTSTRGAHPKIAMIGAGSAVFSKNLMADILAHPALRDANLCLVDIDATRLDTARLAAESINAALGAGAVISASLDRRTALEGADFVVCTIGVGGTAATRIDLELPLQYGLKQTVGDTLGIGGIFRAIRSIPEVLQICHDMEVLCPNALLINYSNPMAMHCLAIERATDIRSVGLCHGVRNTAKVMRMLVALLDHSPEPIIKHFTRSVDSPKRFQEWAEWFAMGDDAELKYVCAGINHMAFFLTFESAGRDLYPELKKALDIPHLRRFDPVRMDLYERLGYFMTETSGHTAEYVPYFLKDDLEITKHHLCVNSYVQTCIDLVKAGDALREHLLSGGSAISTPYEPSVEYASEIINAMVTATPYAFNGNVHNRGGTFITNLPGDCCVEVPCIADGNGIHPTSIGDLPPQCAALIRTNTNVQDLTVRGIIDGSRTSIRHAAMLDPNTASCLTLSQIDRLLDDLFEAHKEFLHEGLR